MKRMTITLLVLLLAVLIGSSARSYEILLDMDLDDDPTTINDFTYDLYAGVRLVMQPSEPDETITSIFFGLGGSCLECQGVHEYGTGFDLDAQGMYADWTEVPELTVPADGIAVDWALSLDCIDDPGFHAIFRADATDGQFTLSAPMFIATFDAWQQPPPGGGCPEPASNLAAFFEQGEDGFWNYIQIGGPAIGVEQRVWSQVKALYR